MTYLSREQVREIDRRATAEFGIPSLVLMENAGRGCAELMIRLNPKRLPVTIFCGPGNNGGDGFVVARHLYNHARGWNIMIRCPGDPEQLTGDALINYRIIRDSGKIPINGKGYQKGPGWVVDALFGTGLSRAIEEPYFVFGTREQWRYVLAIDIPSGLDCDTGEPLGPCMAAMHTATFVAPKLGFQNPNAKLYTGEVHVIDIGVPRKLIEDV